MTLLYRPLAKGLLISSQVFMSGDGQLLPGKISHLCFPQKARQSVSLAERIGSFNFCSIPIDWFTCFSSHIDIFPPFLFSFKFLSGMSILLLALLSVSLLYTLTDLRGGTAVGTGNKCSGIFITQFIYF